MRHQSLTEITSQLFRHRISEIYLFGVLCKKAHDEKRLALRNSQSFNNKFLQYFDQERDSRKTASFLSFLTPKHILPEDIRDYLLTTKDIDVHFPPKELLPYELTIENLIKQLEQRNVLSIYGRPVRGDNGQSIKNIHELRMEIIKLWKYPNQRTEVKNAFTTLDELSQVYLFARAYDLFLYGEQTANATFPEPNLYNAKTIVTALAQEIQEIVQEKPFRDKYQLEVRHGQDLIKIYQNKSIAEISYSPPVTLPVKTLSATERTALKNACLAELSGSSVLTVLNDFVRFCDLLARPENHVQVPSTQYIETQVNTYSTQEMINQAAKEITRLPRGVAYATLLQDVNDTQIVRIVKIQTARIAEAQTLTGVGEIVKKNAIRAGILRKRSDIDEEIIQRQAQWQVKPDNDPPLPPHTGGGKPPGLPSGRTRRKSVPPPTHYIPAQTPENTLNTGTDKSDKAKARPKGKVLDITPRLCKRQEEVGNKRKTQKNLRAAKNLHDETLNGLDQTLRVSLPYIDESIEKVSYEIEGDFINLIILVKDRFVLIKEKIVFTTGSHLPVLDEKQMQDIEKPKRKPRKEFIVAIPYKENSIQKIDYTISGHYLHINFHGSLASSFNKRKVRFPRKR